VNWIDKFETSSKYMLAYGANLKSKFDYEAWSQQVKHDLQRFSNTCEIRCNFHRRPLIIWSFSCFLL
jgi:hypothetical protein